MIFYHIMIWPQDNVQLKAWDYLQDFLTSDTIDMIMRFRNFPQGFSLDSTNPMLICFATDTWYLGCYFQIQWILQRNWIYCIFSSNKKRRFLQLTEYSVSHCFYWIFLDLKISVISVILHVGISYVYISMDVVKNIKWNQKILKNHEEFHKSMEIMKNIQKSWKISKNHEKFQNLYSEYCIRYHLYFTEYYWILLNIRNPTQDYWFTEYYWILLHF